LDAIIGAFSLGVDEEDCTADEPYGQATFTYQPLAAVEITAN
jgi:hypothetical protein